MTLYNDSHVPVLLQEVMEFLLTPETKTMFDGTLGLGGHGEAVLTAFPKISYVACDLDKEHLDFAKNRLQKFEGRTSLHHGSFTNMGEWLGEKIDRPLSILLDLGLCSHHVDNPEKGFSFESEGPLNMAFDGSQDYNAEAFLNEASIQDLTRVLREYGEEPRAKFIAQNIIKQREHSSLRTTKDLRGAVEKSVYPQDLKKALMRVFQGIRIEINNELGVLQEALDAAFSVMEPGDLLGVMSYHSLEDRIVKKNFKKASQPLTEEGVYSKHQVVAPAQFELLTKRPIKASPDEVLRNPRSRSASFRILKKI